MAEDGILSSTRNKALIGGIAILVLVFAASGFHQTQTQDDEGRTLYTAELSYSISNPAFRSPRISRYDVANFQEQGAFELAPQSTASILTDQLESEIGVSCAGEQVFFKKQNAGVDETKTVGKDLKLENLPEGTQCSYNIRLLNRNTGEMQDSITSDFRVPTR